MFNDLTRWTKEGLIQKVKRLEKEVAEWQWKYYEAKGLIEVKDEELPTDEVVDSKEPIEEIE